MCSPLVVTVVVVLLLELPDRVVVRLDLLDGERAWLEVVIWGAAIGAGIAPPKQAQAAIRRARPGAAGREEGDQEKDWEPGENRPGDDLREVPPTVTREGV